MRRVGIIITLTILTFAMIISSTYAWLTYVQKKGFVSIETHELSMILDVNDTVVSESLVLDDLAFIDYERDFILDETNTLNEMASSWLIKLESSETSPLAKHKVTLSGTQQGIIYLIIYEGMNGELSEIVTSYDLLIELIISGYETQEEQLAALAVHNQIVLDEIYRHVFNPGDYVEFQIIFWGNYDVLDPQSSYLNTSFEFILSVESVSSKGEVLS